MKFYSYTRPHKYVVHAVLKDALATFNGESYLRYEFANKPSIGDLYLIGEKPPNP